jgi:hypothetical protein
MSGRDINHDRRKGPYARRSAGLYRPVRIGWIVATVAAACSVLLLVDMIARALGG